MPGKVKKDQGREKASKKGILQRLNLTESYTSLILGIVVVVIISFLVVAFIRSQNNNQSTANKTNESESNVNQKKETSGESLLASANLPTTYTVKQGDSLWNIAQDAYKSGYNWVDIAAVNKLADPSIIHAGNKLTIPKVNLATEIVNAPTKEEQVALTPAASSISGNSYTVVKGDFLWSISVRAYGDGFKWVEIARVNNLANPDIITEGQILKLPR